MFNFGRDQLLIIETFDTSLNRGSRCYLAPKRFLIATTMPHPYRAGTMRGLPPAGAALVSLLADGPDGRRPNFTATRGARLPVFSIVNSGTGLRKALSFIQCADHQRGIGLVVRRIGHESGDVDPALSAD